MVIYGLLIVGLLVAVGVPATKTEWQFAIVICVLGLVEGAILVATPALVRDFSPQLGRASAMGFWTVGPVAGSLITSIVATYTLNHFLRRNCDSGFKSQFIISGVTSLVVFVLALFFMKDLSSRLRDQLMVSEQDRALVEARARGLSTEEVIAATPHPWRQILKWDLVGSALGISLFLLVYYAASAFFTIYWATVFTNKSGLNLSTSQANYLNIWFWGADAVALIVFGVLSDRLRVRKPLMLVGAVGSIVMLILFSTRPTTPHRLHHPDHPRGAAGCLHLARPTRRGWPATPRWSRRRTRPWSAPGSPCGGGSCASPWASRSSSSRWWSTRSTRWSTTSPTRRPPTPAPPRSTSSSSSSSTPSSVAFATANASWLQGRSQKPQNAADRRRGPTRT